MSLEDTSPPLQDSFEIGDKLCMLPPGKMNLVTQEYYEMNEGKYSMFYYVQRIPPNVLHNEKEMIIVHWVPKSREDELVPK
jgi:hypothetical protein